MRAANPVPMAGPDRGRLAGCPPGCDGSGSRHARAPRRQRRSRPLHLRLRAHRRPIGGEAKVTVKAISSRGRCPHPDEHSRRGVLDVNPQPSPARLGQVRLRHRLRSPPRRASSSAATKNSRPASPSLAIPPRPNAVYALDLLHPDGSEESAGRSARAPLPIPMCRSTAVGLLRLLPRPGGGEWKPAPTSTRSTSSRAKIVSAEHQELTPYRHRPLVGRLPDARGGQDEPGHRRL